MLLTSSGHRSLRSSSCIDSPAARLSLADGWEREAQAFLEAGRDWEAVGRALRDSVGHGTPLPGDQCLAMPSGLPEEPPPPAGGRTKQRETWALSLAYYGPAFRRGFAWQPEAPEETVMGRLQAALEPLLASAHHGLFLSSAGRTDAGVSATGQLVTFYSWVPLSPEQLHAAVAEAAPAPRTLVLRAARRVPRAFHATFAATRRRYTYLLPASPGGDVPAEALDALLKPLAGAARDYRALGRGLPKGKDPSTRILAAAASRVALPCGAEAVRLDVAGDRFLRRQVRTLVATAVHAARSRPGDELALYDLATCGDVHRTAPAAPAIGLCLAEAGYGAAAPGDEAQSRGESGG